VVVDPSLVIVLFDTTTLSWSWSFFVCTVADVGFADVVVVVGAVADVFALLLGSGTVSFISSRSSFLVVVVVVVGGGVGVGVVGG
jgi:hypothetical protein